MRTLIFSLISFMLGATLMFFIHTSTCDDWTKGYNECQLIEGVTK